jgi:hypothetical protein
MRVIGSAPDGTDVEGVVIGGEAFDQQRGSFDLDATFKVRSLPLQRFLELFPIPIACPFMHTLIN